MQLAYVNYIANHSRLPRFYESILLNLDFCKEILKINQQDAQEQNLPVKEYEPIKIWQNHIHAISNLGRSMSE